MNDIRYAIWRLELWSRNYGSYDDIDRDVSEGKLIRYAIWRLELWSRNYGSYDDIDRDVSEGKLIPGLMPDAYHREGDKWRKQSEVAL